MFRTADAPREDPPPAKLTSRSTNELRDHIFGLRPVTMIEINVVDEAKNVRKSFTCERRLVLSKMQYFRS